MSTSPSLGRPTDLPCPACGALMRTQSYTRSKALVWCAGCGWNLAGSAKFLRASNLGEFGRSACLLPLAVPVAYLFHRMDPFLAYGLDLLLVIGVFLPALLRSQGNLNLARTFDAMAAKQPFKPRTAAWQREPELAAEAPRPARLRGTTEPVRGLLLLLRFLWAMVFISGVVALTPVARLVGPKVQVSALMMLAMAVLPLMGSVVALVLALLRDRHLAVSGHVCEGAIALQATHLRRVGSGEWTLSSRYRYRFTDPHGTPRDGAAREEGRALVEGAPLTVLDSPRDPRLHASYPACLYRVGEEGSASETRDGDRSLATKA